MKILIVDDSRAMRMIVVRNLRQAGFDEHEIVEVTSSEEALTHIQSQPPEVILCDWSMPDALALLHGIKEAQVKTQFGFFSLKESEALHQAGAQFVITKPFTPEHFQEVLTASISPNLS